MSTPRGGWLSLALAGLAMAGVAGCSTYDGRYGFTPRPVEVQLTAPGDAGSARALVAIAGVRRADRETAAPRSVEVRLRVDNTGHTPVVVEPASLTLLTGDLREFPAPTLDPEQTVELAPQESATVTALFPMADGEVTHPRLDGLHVQWTLVVDAARVSGTATFARRRRHHHDHYAFHFGSRFGHHHHGFFHPFDSCWYCW